MKKIIAATVTVLLCSGSLAYAQQSATPAQQPAAAATGGAVAATPAKSIDPKSLTPNQRAYIFNAMLSLNANIPPKQLQDFSDSYSKMPPDQQTALASQMVSQLQQMPAQTRDPIIANMPAQ